MPQMGESITEGTITKWLKKVGDTVQRDEPMFEISTDKVDAEIPSPVAGMLYRDQGRRGCDGQINTVVAVIGGAAGKAAPAASLLRRSIGCCCSLCTCRCSALPHPLQRQGEHVRSSPLVRKIAKDNNVDLTAGSGHRIRRPHHQERHARPSRAAAPSQQLLRPRPLHRAASRSQARCTCSRSPASSCR